MSARVAVIGTGMAGLVCAHALQNRGAKVTVFDKSNDIGGRLASRRRRPGQWNHGAPRVNARNPEFRRFLDGLNVIPQICSASQSPAYLGNPDMREMLRPLARELDIVLGYEVQRLHRISSMWNIASKTKQQLGPFDAVLAVLPAPQANALLGRSGELFSTMRTQIDSVRMLPAWTALYLVDASQLKMLEWLGPRPIRRHPTLASIAPGNLLHGGAGHNSTWVVQATHKWSFKNLEMHPSTVASELWATLQQANQAAGAALPDPIESSAHRWRYALTGTPLGKSHLWSNELRVGLAGDWCLGATAEDAFLSGRALAADLAARLLPT